jgi:hypothetical protein
MRELPMAGVKPRGTAPRTFKIKTTVYGLEATFPSDLVERDFDEGRINLILNSYV